MARIGIISFAHMHAYGYANALMEVDNAELVAVWDEDAMRGQAAATHYNVPFDANLDALLKRDLDAVIITSENVRHRAHAEAAAKARKWVLCEKPLATTVADAQAMIDACKSAGVGLGTAFPCRYAPSLMEVKKQLDSGEFGKVYAANTTNNGSYPGGWFADPALSGGGATMDHIVHVADLLRWMTGKEFTGIYCEIGTQVRTEIDTDDMGVMNMEMEGGAKVAHIASWNRAKSFPTWGDVTMELICEKGVIQVDAFNQKLMVYDDDAGRGRWAGWGENTDLGLVQDFADAVNNKREPSITGLDGLQAVAVTVAAYESATTGRRVAIG
ncbi:MAG: dehydrogenase [Candidatus Hydrogenedentota bacterium]